MKSANFSTLALLVALAGCNADTGDQAAPANDSAQATVAAAPAAPATEAAVPAVQPAAPAALVPAADGRSLCAADEDIVFSCKLGDGQLASLCASKGASAQSGRVYYAQGPDYVFPADKGAAGGVSFKRTQLGFAGNTGGYAYSFEDGGRKRIVYSISGEGGQDQRGVMSVGSGADASVNVLTCEPSSVVDDIDDALFKFTRSWGRDEAIDRGGLPARP
ncbi:hypothetical protein [Lysobacter silvisoli]|uniref:hypothetical protein n=1 Tax=Lysobacter silvisoli TaxID=2293254 RepID=UPI0013145A30|nr:hypothetical protein [Lysobacter silvisoli]